VREFHIYHITTTTHVYYRSVYQYIQNLNKIITNYLGTFRKLAPIYTGHKIILYLFKTLVKNINLLIFRIITTRGRT